VRGGRGRRDGSQEGGANVIRGRAKGKGGGGEVGERVERWGREKEEKVDRGWGAMRKEGRR